MSYVALRKESVDRNNKLYINRTAITVSLSARRAWIEIPGRIGFLSFHNSSLSARRAWIEIRHTSHDFRAPKVALRKESVDRNKVSALCKTVPSGSLSARRAWIEIPGFGMKIDGVSVALRKESVDRNVFFCHEV